MLVQAGLCQTHSETTLLVFPRGGSNSGIFPLRGWSVLSLILLRCSSGLVVTCVIQNDATWAVVRVICMYTITSKTLLSSRVMVYMSRLMRKPTICICENKDADQLRGNREADQRLCFRYSDSTIPPLLTSKISSF